MQILGSSRAMPSKKSNHFVPRVHLRPFSKDKKGRAISLLNLSSKQFIAAASVSGQCAKDYFYGKDGNLEDWFQKIEGAYGAIIRKLGEREWKIDRDEMNFLRDFALLQHLRTEQSLKRDKLAQIQMLDMVFHGAEERKPQFDMSYASLAESSVAMFQDAVRFVDDLSVCLIKNESAIEFVTSDDPAVRANRFQQKRPGFDGYDSGIMGAGEMIFLPLTPQYLMLSYDKNVYRIEGFRNGCVPVRKATDINCLNELQHLNALNNIYFSGWDKREKILSEAQRLDSERRPERFCVNYAVFDHRSERGEVFRAISDMSEVSGTERAMIATHMWALRPTQWPSFLKYRHKPKYLVVGSAKNWLRRNDKQYDETPHYF